MGDFRGLPASVLGNSVGSWMYLPESVTLGPSSARDAAGEETEMTPLLKDQENLTPQVVK